MTDHGFSPARRDETIVYGAKRPGYSAKSVPAADVKEWIDFMKAKNIVRVCCLLPPRQLRYYQVDLLDQYRAAFGPSNLCAVHVEDYHLCDHPTLELMILPFLHDSDRASTPVVVHCSGGSGRTGHVLAAWLVRHRGLSVDEALVAVGRNPREAVQCGYASEKELRHLLAGET